MTTPDQPGWYDDPEDSNAQRYWDGQEWTPHRQRKPAAAEHEPAPAPPPPPPATAASPAPPPPPPPANYPPPAQYSPPQAAPPQPGSSQRNVWLAVAGVSVFILVILVWAGLSHTTSPSSNQSSGVGNNQRVAPQPGNNPPAAPQPGNSKPSWAGPHYKQGRSPAYYSGYEHGNQYMNVSGTFGGTQGFFAQANCNRELNRQHVANRDAPDWLAGCVDGLADEPNQ